MAKPSWLESLYVVDRGQYVLSHEARSVITELDDMIDPELTIANWMAWRERLAKAFNLVAPRPHHLTSVTEGER